MVLIVSVPLPNFRWAIGIHQLVENSLSAPRGPLCWISLRNASPWNISVQPALVVMSISNGGELGSASVPEVAWWRRDSPGEAAAIFIFSVLVLSGSMPGIPGMDCDSPDMSMTGPEVLPEAGTTRHDRFTSAIKSSFRTN